MNRKLAKLLRSPLLFFIDAGANLMKRAGIKPRASSRRLTPCRWHYSFITVIANEQDLKSASRLVTMLGTQTVDAKSFVELICVDTRVADSVPWVAPTSMLTRVEVIRTPGASEAQARNAGLGRVGGDWTSFMELDELIHKDYIERVDRLLKSGQGTTLGLACCKLAYRDTRTGKVLDTHVRKAQFLAKAKVFTLSEQPAFFATSLAGLFFRTSLLRLQSARLISTGVKGVEEIAFISQFLHRIGELQIGRIADARVLVSTKQQRRECEEVFLREAESIAGCSSLLIDLLRLGRVDDTHVPRAYIQLAVLHFLCVTADHAVSYGIPASSQAATSESAIDQMYADVLHQISEADIDSFNHTSARNRVGLLRRYKDVGVRSHVLHVDAYDEENSWTRIRYFAAEAQPLECFQWGSTDIIPAIAKSRVLEFLGRPFVYERTVWLPCEADGRLVAQIAAAPAAVYMSGKPRADLHPWMIAEELSRRPAARRAHPWRVRAMRRLAARPNVAAKYRNAWLFIDRDIEADDNAEHLYRYAREAHPEINAFFILHRKSPSWQRLEHEGFRLIPFGTLAHKVALLHCRHLLSSHAAPFVLNMLPKALYGDLLNYRFTFLQHGVTKDDISKWINTRSIDCFITTSSAEYKSIASDANRYKLTPREVAMTGFPRHDALLRGADKVEKLVMIMPTWRLFLAGALKGGSSKRSLNDAFFKSQYAAAWKSMLHCERFAQMLQQHGFKAVLFPHPNIEPYLEWFEVPPHIEVIRGEERRSIQSLFQRAALMVTDYSSVAFEMAYLSRPVLYYQFDRELVFGGQHSYQKGYYDYDRQGFGPVSDQETSLLDNLETFLSNDCAPGEEYLRRMKAAFAHIDTENCKRTLDAVRCMDEPGNGRGAMPELAVRYAELASQHGQWPLAADRWARVAATDVGDPRSQAVLMQARALRHMGRFEEANGLLDTHHPRGSLSVQYVVERAENACAQQRWTDAHALWQSLAASEDCQDGDRERFMERAQESIYLASISEAESTDSAVAQTHATDDGPSSETEFLNRESLARKLSDWAGVLELPQMDDDVRTASRRELARLRIKAGEYEAAEQDIATLHVSKGQTPSELLLTLELALALSHAEEASATLNVMMDLPLNVLTRSERHRFAEHLRTLTNV